MVMLCSALLAVCSVFGWAVVATADTADAPAPALVESGPPASADVLGAQHRAP